MYPIKTKQSLCVSWKLGESTRLRMGESLPTHHEDPIAGKGDNPLQHYNMAYKFIPMSGNENSSSKGSSGQGMGKIGENFGVEPDESQKQETSDR